MTPSIPQLRARGFRGLRVVGDVHGEAKALEAAIIGGCDEDLFIIQLGDLTDYGPDSPGVLRAAFAMLDAEAGLFLLGNHDHKLRRALVGARVRSPAEATPRTLEQLREAPDGEWLSQRAVEAIAKAPAWLRLGNRIFVHAAFHPAMLFDAAPRDTGTRRPDGIASRALFGQVTGRTQGDGYPERLLHWVDSIPPGITVFCGHDQRSTDGRPWRTHGRLGGEAVFVDTGSGKGGHLSWVDLEF
ncbi:metallophosphoesterase [Roseococcus sp. YIM B11640]|uniref:metallophosphoesterase n=1 Tax=Roseococcus sp. YIM B11640 TaxID=3133973 RepID=UPI003C7BDC97